MATSSFRAGGLASGLDSNSIIEQLVALERRPIDMLKARQSAFKTQVSSLGTIASKLKLLGDAVDALGTTGVAATTVKSTTTSFAATTSAGSRPGRYSVEVTSLAAAASARAVRMDGATSEVRAGTLDLSVEGQSWQVTIAAGATLADVAYSIRTSGAPVTATVLEADDGAYLQIARTESGYDPDGLAADALQIVENSTGGSGTPLGISSFQSATNASVLVEGLSFVRRTNDLSGVIEGVALTAKSIAAAEQLVVGSDTAATSANVKKFVTAYNDVLKLVQLELNPTQNTDRSKTLTGDPTMRSLQGRLQSLLSTTLGLNANVRTLADIGLKTQRDGSLLLDEARLTKVLGTTPDALEGLFTEPTSGLDTKLKSLVKDYTDTIDGMLIARQKGLGALVDRLTDDVANGELRVAAFEKNLVARFTAMEKIVSSLNATSSFLSQQTFSNSNSGEN